MLILSLALALAAAAAAESPPAIDAKAAAPLKRDKMVCKTIGDTQWRTASSRVCKKRSEWDAITKETQKEYRDYGRTGSQGDLNGN